jgi:ABC-type phosphate transport system ATPase subunit
MDDAAMAEVRERAFSTSLTPDVGMRVKTIAHRENRSFANVIESAVKVFTLFPKDVRDILVDAAADADTGRRRLKELARILMYQDAMRRLDEAANGAAGHMTVEPNPQDYDDAVVVERHP